MPSEEKHLDQEIPRETNHFAVIALLVLCLASQDAPDSNDYREHTMEIQVPSRVLDLYSVTLG
jgi:hypothetical protein